MSSSPSSALLTFFGGGFPYQNRIQNKVGTLILTSLPEDLGVLICFAVDLPFALILATATSAHIVDLCKIHMRQSELDQ